uniref:Uncharacterized protein n=1 Tax=Glossina palpalis gambiensis TaxID=67801 RepID=A0A1B0C257_9MUSC
MPLTQQSELSSKAFTFHTHRELIAESILNCPIVIWGDGSTPSNLKSSKGFEALLFIFINSPLKVLISSSILELFCFNCSSYGIPANGQVASAELWLVSKTYYFTLNAQAAKGDELLSGVNFCLGLLSLCDKSAVSVTALFFSLFVQLSTFMFVLDIPGGCIGDSCSPISLAKSIVRIVRFLALSVLSGDKHSKVDIGDNDPNELLSEESDNLPIMAER